MHFVSQILSQRDVQMKNARCSLPEKKNTSYERALHSREHVIQESIAGNGYVHKRSLHLRK